VNVHHVGPALAKGAKKFRVRLRAPHNLPGEEHRLGAPQSSISLLSLSNPSTVWPCSRRPAARCRPPDFRRSVRTTGNGCVPEDPQTTGSAEMVKSPIGYRAWRPGSGKPRALRVAAVKATSSSKHPTYQGAATDSRGTRVPTGKWPNAPCGGRRRSRAARKANMSLEHDMRAYCLVRSAS
jgi:hypothetical protein